LSVPKTAATSGLKVTWTASADLAIDITSPEETPMAGDVPTATASRPSPGQHVVEVAPYLGGREVGVGEATP